MDRPTTMGARLAAMLLLVSGGGAAFGQVSFEKQPGDRVAITVDGAPFSVLYLGTDYPKPFLAPLTSASGQVVTRRFPMEKVEGESDDHQHHRGMWTGYGEINGLNFWENEFKYDSHAPKNFDAAKNGRLLVRGAPEMTGGKKSGQLTLQLDWAAPDGTAILTESRTYTFSAGGKDERMVDVDFTLTAKQRAEFADTKEGFFAIRLADSMAEKNGGVMTNSEGAQTEKNVWGKPANWVDYVGTVDGKKVGIAIFDHPGNFRHPERWHSRAYGLFAVNPFGLKDFDPKSTERGGYTLAAGAKLHFQYRVVIHPGDLTKKRIDEMYGVFAK